MTPSYMTAVLSTGADMRTGTMEVEFELEEEKGINHVDQLPVQVHTCFSVPSSTTHHLQILSILSIWIAHSAYPSTYFQRALVIPFPSSPRRSMLIGSSPWTHVRYCTSKAPITKSLHYKRDQIMFWTAKSVVYSALNRLMTDWVDLGMFNSHPSRIPLSLFRPLLFCLLFFFLTTP